MIPMDMAAKSHRITTRNQLHLTHRINTHRKREAIPDSNRYMKREIKVKRGEIPSQCQ
jgi:hypothetical protein